VYTRRPKRDCGLWRDEEIADELRQLKYENIASLTIWVAPKRDERENQKDRFVMFGDKYVWDLGHGLEPFEDATVQSNCSATLKTWESTGSYQVLLDAMQGIKTKRIKVWG